MDSIIQFPSRVSETAGIRACRKPQLARYVPDEVNALFEVARGSMIYGWLFYPLVTLASQQCHRVLETGARTRCEQLGIQCVRRLRNGRMLDVAFADLIQRLTERNTIPRGDVRRWEAQRWLRNKSSHPKSQSIYSAGDGLTILESTAELLNRVFQG